MKVREKACLVCGKMFRYESSTAKFCSNSCRQKHKRAKGRQGGSIPNKDKGQPPQIVRAEPFGKAPESFFPEILSKLDDIIRLLGGKVQPSAAPPPVASAIPEQYLTPVKVMEYLSINRTTFERWKAEGRLKVYRIGGEPSPGSKDGRYKGKIYCKLSELMALFEQG